MEWTTERPTAPGYYWTWVFSVRHGQEAVLMAHVTFEDGWLGLHWPDYQGGVPYRVAVSNTHVLQWMGPLPEPPAPPGSPVGARPPKEVTAPRSLERRAATVAVVPDPCPLCKRPNYVPSDHHLVPKCRGGKETETVCADCHKAIHVIFSNKELERTYNTVEALMSHEGFARMVRFISKQDGRVKMDLSQSQKRRGRNG